MSAPEFSAKLLAKLAEAEMLVAFTGAGVSAESGVPTFRGDEGLWAKFRPEELANVNAFMKNPELVWRWYADRRKVMASIEPNPGHRALVELERIVPHVTIVTQNIDNLHRRAGSAKVFELHGNIERNYCMRCGVRYDDVDVVLEQGIPRCSRVDKDGKRCPGYVRPDVVWFGEILPEDEWYGAVRAMESADVVLSIGTSGIVYPAASLPQIARSHGAFLVEINPEPTPLTDQVDEFLMGQSGVFLPRLVEKVKQIRAHAPR
ncbi:MAG: NAD-dependent deacylase [Ignavibacteria bacterium]|nr:NAD-dependent deacylase [Ignavibacteria bacterium]